MNALRMVYPDRILCCINNLLIVGTALPLLIVNPVQGALDVIMNASHETINSGGRWGGDMQGREKDLKEKVAQLQKQVEELTAQLADKNEVIHTMTTDMDKMVRMSLDVVFFFSESFIFFFVCVCVCHKCWRLRQSLLLPICLKLPKGVFFTQKR